MGLLEEGLLEESHQRTAQHDAFGAVKQAVVNGGY